MPDCAHGLGQNNLINSSSAITINNLSIHIIIIHHTQVTHTIDQKLVVYN